ncbi:neuronal acetylcholine receptor subunit beta-4 [Neodiprion lecontei]|uniref:Neuronal acetylcholine receptor subunit beta-4 n=1 Tax=Neodiprion lecontei TaxID=441921 RepID=A0A6J0B4B9_NEOLC|nr:neuronal acetylcholine receptor subunit beta-4 [Neodiprion lecontei]
MGGHVCKPFHDFLWFRSLLIIRLRVTVEDFPVMLTKRLFLWIVIFAVHTAKISVDASSDCNSVRKGEPATMQLKRCLLRNYDPFIRPAGVSTNGTTVVSIALTPKHIDFVDRKNILIFHTWIRLSWSDGNLSWTSGKRGIDRLHIDSDEIWMPPLTMYSSAEVGYEHMEIPPTDCVLLSSGDFHCVVEMNYVSHCVADYRHWPFDKHNCSIILGSWFESHDEIKYHVKDKKTVFGGLMTLDFTPNPEWKLVSFGIIENMTKRISHDITIPSVVYNVIIERYSAYMQTTILAPAVLLIILTLAVLWLDPTSVERLLLAALNLICHLLCMLNLSEKVPFNGSSLPSILVFHQNSMIIASVTLFLTVVLRQMLEISGTASALLASTESIIFKSRAARLAETKNSNPSDSATVETENDDVGLVDADGPQAENDPGSSNAWQRLITFIDRLAFAGAFITYVVMIWVLTPRNDINTDAPDFPVQS